MEDRNQCTSETGCIFKRLKHDRRLAQNEYWTLNHTRRRNEICKYVNFQAHRLIFEFNRNGSDTFKNDSLPKDGTTIVWKSMRNQFSDIWSNENNNEKNLAQQRKEKVKEKKNTEHKTKLNRMSIKSQSDIEYRMLLEVVFLVHCFKLHYFLQLKITSHSL